MTNKLEDLRASIREVDEQMVRLMARRMTTAAAIGDIKKRTGLPLRNWEVEKDVLTFAERAAGEIGVSPTLVRGVMQLLIAEACGEQERRSFSGTVGTGERILIVGGRGKMGEWFSDFLQNQGHRVEIYDTHAPNDQPTPTTPLAALLTRSSMALIATPLEAVPGVITELAGTRYPGTVFDIASLKGHLKSAIAEAQHSGLSVCSIHPLFGPSARTLSDKVICVCDCGDMRATQRVRALFDETAAALVDLSFEEHDLIMSHVLALSHLMNIVFAAVLSKSGYPFDRLDQVGSATFHSQMVTTSTVIEESPDLYFSIQRLNPFAAELFERLKGELEVMTSAVLGNDRSTFVESMLAARRWKAGARTEP